MEVCNDMKEMAKRKDSSEEYNTSVQSTNVNQSQHPYVAVLLSPIYLDTLASDSGLFPKRHNYTFPLNDFIGNFSSHVLYCCFEAGETIDFDAKRYTIEQQPDFR